MVKGNMWLVLLDRVKSNYSIPFGLLLYCDATMLNLWVVSTEYTGLVVT